MVASAFTAPHVTEFVTVDVTARWSCATALRGRPEFRDVKVSPAAARRPGGVLAVAAHPEINSAGTSAAQEIVLKHYVNLGIAAATAARPDRAQHQGRRRAVAAGAGRGARRADRTARAGTDDPADMTGGTITITNVGVFGVDAGTPILNPGESGDPRVRRDPRHAVGASDGPANDRAALGHPAGGVLRPPASSTASSRREFLADVAAMLTDPCQLLTG